MNTIFEVRYVKCKHSGFNKKMLSNKNTVKKSHRYLNEKLWIDCWQLTLKYREMTARKLNDFSSAFCESL